MKKKSIVMSILIILVIATIIVYQWQEGTISTDEACAMNDGLYTQSLSAPGPNNDYESKTANYHISQFYKYKNMLYYPITVQAKRWSQSLEPRDNTFYFYSYHCETATLTNLDPDGYNFLETKILQANSGDMLIRRDNPNDPQTIRLHINPDGSIETKKSIWK